MTLIEETKNWSQERKDWLLSEFKGNIQHMTEYAIEINRIQKERKIMKTAKITLKTIKQNVPKFFSKGAMSFFNSKIESEAHVGANPLVAYFITSEKYDCDSPRLFTLKKYDHLKRTIDTVGEFQQHETRTDAFNALCEVF